MSRVLQIDQETAYQSLRAQLLERLLGGQFPPGARFHSVRDVAQWPGATAHLAQRALAELCRSGYLESVPKKGLFVAEPGAYRARAAKQQQQTAGVPNDLTPDGGRYAARKAPAHLLLFLIPPGSNQSRVNELLPMISHGLDHEQWRMEVVYLRPQYDAQGGGFKFIEGLVARNPTAVVWLMPQPSDMLLVRYLVTNGIPTVTYNRDFSATGAFGVIADVRDAARQLFQRLWDQGKRRFAVVSISRPSPSIAQFPDAVAEIARERGADLRRVVLEFDSLYEQFPDEAARRQVSSLLDDPATRPDAVLCAEWHSLYVVEHWLAAHPDVRVPADLGIASFDRIVSRPVIRVLPAIPLAEMDHDRMMCETMDMIGAAMAGRRVEPPVRVVPAIMSDDPSPAFASPARAS